MTVPLVDLTAQHRQVADEVLAGMARVMAETSFVGGKDVAAFEQEFAEFSGVRHCIGVGNGTDALELALRAAGIGAGDEVVLPANTFIATAEAVVRAGGVPVLADVEPDSLLVDPDAMAAAVTPRTAALLPVHLFGQLARMEDVAGIAAAHGLVVLEDAAQAHGATRLGRPAGAWGRATGISFYPGKNLGAYGDAGAVLTDDDEVARLARLVADHGASEKYQHELLGFNSRLDTLQAVVLRAKLPHLAAWNRQRAAAAERYDRLLAGLPEVRRPTVLPGNTHVWHLYVVRVPGRDAVLGRLRAAGIGAGMHYPVPLHLQPALRGLGLGPGAFPVAEAAAAEILSLPMFPGITPAQQERVVTELAGALQP